LVPIQFCGAITMPVETKSVQRRQLRFTTIADILAEAERLAAADRAGALTTLGNWSVGQIFNHIASWASYPYEGFPSQIKKPPVILRPIIKLSRGWLLNKGFPPGFRIPDVEGGTVGNEPLSTEDGLKKLRAALARLDATPPVHPSPAFGDLTHDEVKQLNMRHAELHLGFLQPR
jgi:hypothetical protein